MIYIKTLIPFYITFKYLALSYLKPHQLRQLKQSWASDVLKYLGYDVFVKGEPPKNGATICVGNHFSFLDILVLMAAHPDVVFLSKIEVKSWPIIGPGAVRVGTLFVNREVHTDRSKLRDQIAHELNDKKAHLVIFPSGTTTLNEELPWKKGAFEIAHKANVPVKLFKLVYHPFRESAYVDDDTLLGQLSKILKIKNKNVTVTWLNEYKIENSIVDSEKIRLDNINFS